MNKIIFAALLDWVAEDFSVSNSANLNDPAEPLTSAWVGLSTEAINGLYPSALAIANATFRGVYGAPAAEFIENMALKWEYRYSDAEDRTEEAGESVNPFYLSFDTPIDGPFYHTVVHTGCVAAEGKTTQQAVFDAIWDEFEGKEMKCYMVENGAVVPQKQVKRDAQGNVVFDEESGEPKKENIILSYYGSLLTNAQEITNTKATMVVQCNSNGIPQLPSISSPTVAQREMALDTGSLLQHKDGKCGAWAEFMVSVLGAQGLSSSVRTIVTNTPYTGFKVDPMLDGQGGLPNDFMWRNHGVVEFAGKIYDPSYGKEYGLKNLALQNFSGNVASVGTINQFLAPSELTGWFGGRYMTIKTNPSGTDFDWFPPVNPVNPE